ncbi:MAG: hypothetical protein ACRDQH_18450 [Pseudonocardiaceae bacterium]
MHVTEGVGLCQHEGGPVEVIRPGDRVFFEPGENHWHGAAHIGRGLREWTGRLCEHSNSAWVSRHDRPSRRRT